MLRWMMNTLLVVGLMGSAAAFAQEGPQPAKPQKEHEWLQQLVGEWETHGKAEAEPGQPAFECDGKESISSLGGLWMIAKGEASAMGMRVESRLTLGYDPAKQKFVGTWVDTMFNHMWTYEGTLDSSGKVLTLLTEGPSVTKPGETAKYKEVLEIKDKDHKQFTSHVQAGDGKWQTIVTVDATRVKK